MKLYWVIAIVCSLVFTNSIPATLISPTLTEFVVFSEGKMSFNADVAIAGSIGAGDKFTVDNNLILLGNLYARSRAIIGSNSEISGAVLADDLVKLKSDSQSGNIESAKIYLKENTVVSGDVQYQKKLSKHKTSAIIGNQLGPIQLALWQQPQMSFAPILPQTETENQYFKSESEHTLEPGSYDKLKVKPYGTLFLSAGQYNFNNIILSKGVLVVADTRNGNITINVTGDFKSYDDVTFGNAGGGQVTMNVGDNLTIGNDNQFYINLTAWDDIVVKKRSLVAGTILGKDKVKLYQEVQVNPAMQFSYSFPEVPEPAAILFLLVGTIIIFHRGSKIHTHK